MDIFTDLISVCKIISVELQHIIALVLSGIGDTAMKKKKYIWRDYKYQCAVN